MLNDSTNMSRLRRFTGAAAVFHQLSEISVLNRPRQSGRPLIPFDSSENITASGGRRTMVGILHMSYLFKALLIGATLVFTGREQLFGAQVEQITLQEKVAPHTNPTNYEFDVSVGEMKIAIEKACGFKWQEAQAKTNHERVWKGGGSSRAKHSLTQALQQSGADLLWKGDADALAQNLFKIPGNEADACLYGGGSPVGESLTYFKDGQPLIYFADFHIHLVAITPHKTRVDIFTYNSSVVTGVDESWSPHGPSFIFVKVPPTTIEQYQILIRIGEALGVNDMPRLVKPLPDGSTRELKLPRER